MKKEKLGIALIIIGIITIIIGIYMINSQSIEKYNLEQELESYKSGVLDYSMIVDARERDLAEQEERYNELFESNIKLYAKFESLLEKAISNGIDVSEYYDKAESEDLNSESLAEESTDFDEPAEVMEPSEVKEPAEVTEPTKPIKKEPAVNEEELDPDKYIGETTLPGDQPNPDVGVWSVPEDQLPDRIKNGNGGGLIEMDPNTKQLDPNDYHDGISIG